jgi:hypothetical protein
MAQRTLFRVGAIAAMIGAALGLIFNLLHPRASGIDTSQEELDLVADSGIWLFDHFMLAWALAFSILGLVAIARSFTGDNGEAWGRFALVAAIIAIAVGFVTITIDGMAVKEVADNWADAGRGTNSAAFATGDAVANVSLALFTAVIGSLFGLTPTLFGVASLVSRDYPRWLGYVALVAGILGFVTASITFLSGPSDFALNVLFGASSGLYTIWFFVSGWFLWQKAAARSDERVMTTAA